MKIPLLIEAIYISPGHNYFAHHGAPAGTHPVIQVDQVECIAGKGLRGDRFFSHENEYKGQVPLFDAEVYETLRQTLQIHDKAPSIFRRNILTRSMDLNQRIGREFEIQENRFVGVCECSPCPWMNEAFGPSAEAELKGRGGLRARIQNKGILKTNAVLNH